MIDHGYDFRDRGYSDRDFFTERLQNDDRQIIDSASKASVCYLVCKTKRGIEPVIVYCKWSPRGWPNFEWQAYTERDMDRMMGRGRADRCPQRILDQLDSLEQLYPGKGDPVGRWRQRCREHIAKRQANPSVSRGDVIIFEKEIRFRSGVRHSELRFESGSTFSALHDPNELYMVRNWRDREFVRIKARQQEQREQRERVEGSALGALIG